MVDNAISIRTLVTISDYKQAEIVQCRIWSMPDGSEIESLPMLLTAQKNGGLVAGAFSASGEMIGLLFGFVGLTPEGKPKHCSHLMGVVPAFRRQRVGEALKLFQRRYVQAQGIDLITWTFDPLEGVNASLNIAKLGGITRTYYANLYGSMTDATNIGLPSDRFEVEWWINSPRVREFVEARRERPHSDTLLAQGAQLTNTVDVDAAGLPSPVSMKLDAEAPLLLVEVPPEFQAIKAVSMDMAQVWREHTRALFEHYFAAGYAVTDFISDQTSPDRRRNFYVLAREITNIFI